MQETSIEGLHSAYSINFYIDADISETFDLLSLLESCESFGIFHANTLSRMVVHRINGSMAKGNISTKSAQAKLKSIIEAGDCSTATLVQDERIGHDKQNLISFHRSYDYERKSGFRTVLRVHALKGVSEYSIEQLFMKMIEDYSPRYAFSSIYILDDFTISYERIKPIDLVNVQHPVHNTNLNYFGSFVWDGGIKDFCWLNYFSDTHNRNLNLESDKVKVSRFHNGTLLKMSDSAVFDENGLKELLVLRAKNITHIKSIGIGVD